MIRQVVTQALKNDLEEFTGALIHLTTYSQNDQWNLKTYSNGNRKPVVLEWWQRVLFKAAFLNQLPLTFKRLEDASPLQLDGDGSILDLKFNSSKLKIGSFSASTGNHYCYLQSQ